MTFTHKIGGEVVTIEEVIKHLADKRKRRPLAEQNNKPAEPVPQKQQ